MNIFRRRRVESAIANVEAAARALAPLVQALRAADADPLTLMKAADTAAVAADVVRANAMVLSGLCLDFAKEDERCCHAPPAAIRRQR
jgi:hypothetical protein